MMQLQLAYYFGFTKVYLIGMDFSYDIPEASQIDGNLGVYKGDSARAIAGIFPDHTIHGFDSFEGLPEDWSHVLKGAFGDIKGILPDMPKNVILYKGWFENTLPDWYRKK